MARTLYDKIWDEHVVHTEEDGTSVLYIDRHLVHEVTSPQAFEGLRQAGHNGAHAPDLAAGLADAFEGLGAGDFVHQVAVDVEHGGAVFFGVDDVFVKNLVVERAGH